MAYLCGTLPQLAILLFLVIAKLFSSSCDALTVIVSLGTNKFGIENCATYFIGKSLGYCERHVTAAFSTNRGLYAYQHKASKATYFILYRIYAINLLFQYVVRFT